MEDPELAYCEVINSEKDVQPPPLPERPENISASLIEVHNSPRRIPPFPSMALMTNSQSRRQNSSSKTQVVLSIAVVIFAILSVVFMTLYFRSFDGKNCLPSSGPDNVCQNYSIVSNCSGSKRSNNTGRWRKIGNTCVGAKKDSFGKISYSGSPCFVGAMKLVHKGGHVGCKSRSYSNWGCHTTNGNLISILITDSNNEILYPSRRLVKINKMAYKLPGYTLLSPQLVFTDFGYPKYLEKGDTLRIWYGSDLFNLSEHDNHGSTCMDVHVYCMII